MKKAKLFALATLLVCGVATATQTTNMTLRQVRDPRDLRDILNANGVDIEARVDVLEASSMGVSAWTAISNAVQTTISGDITVTAAGAAAIGDNKVVEADLKAVDAASDEDVFTYEATTGDFEWHSVAQIIAQMAAGGLPDDGVVEADLKAVDTASDEDFLSYESTTGDFEWHSANEAAAKITTGIVGSAISSANIAKERMTNALVTLLSSDVTIAADGAVTIAADAIEKGSFIAGDFGDFTAGADGSCALDADVVAAAEMADADHGDITWASGVAAVDSGAVLGSELGAGNIPNVNVTNALVSLLSGDATITDAGVVAIAADAIEKSSLIAGDFGDFTAGADGTCTLDTGAVTSTKILDGTIAAGDLASTGDGTVVAAHASCVESAVVVEKRVITLTNCVIITADGADVGEGTNIWNGANGAFTVLGAVANLNVVSCSAATTSMKLSVGTALAGEDNDLTSTEADVIPAITFVPDTGGVAADGVLAATVVMNGTAAAKAWYLNLAADNDNLAWNATNTITGTITFFCTPTVDN